MIARALEEDTTAIMASLDLSSAFDMVDIDLLLCKWLIIKNYKEFQKVRKYQNKVGKKLFDNFIEHLPSKVN